MGDAKGVEDGEGSEGLKDHGAGCRVQGARCKVNGLLSRNEN